MITNNISSVNFGNNPAQLVKVPFIMSLFERKAAAEVAISAGKSAGKLSFTLPPLPKTDEVILLAAQKRNVNPIFSFLANFFG